MVRLVFIPSYGTDSTLYNNLRALDSIENPQLYTEWLSVENVADLSEYAIKFIKHYSISSEDIIIGVSLGGVLAIEINKIVLSRKIICISSIIDKSEQPKLFQFLKHTSAYKLFKPKLLKYGLDLIVPFYGKNYSSYTWFRKVFKGSDNQFLKWALGQIVCWNNVERPQNLIHIHGSKDPLFPIRNATKTNYIIQGGTHAMIRFRAEEISTIIKKETT